MLDVVSIIGILGFVLACISIAIQLYLSIIKPERISVKFVPRINWRRKVGRSEIFSGTIRIRNKGEYEASPIHVIFDGDKEKVELIQLKDHKDHDYILNSRIDLTAGELKIIWYEIKCRKHPTPCRNMSFMITTSTRIIAEKKFSLNFL